MNVRRLCLCLAALMLLAGGRPHQAAKRRPMPPPIAFTATPTATPTALTLPAPQPTAENQPAADVVAGPTQDPRPSPPPCDGNLTWWWDEGIWLCLPDVTAVPWPTTPTPDGYPVPATPTPQAYP